MKYKLEFWPFGEFDTVEAAERLNQRAREGWELVNITNQMLSLALYRRNPASAGYRYTVDIVPAAETHDEEYAAFCADAGWEKQVKLNSGVCVFVSRDGSGQPLHTNREVEFEHQLQVLAENHVSTSVIPYVIGIIVIIAFWGWKCYTDLTLWERNDVEPIFLVLLSLACIIIYSGEMLVYGINLFFVKYAKRRLEDGEIAERPTWMKKLYAGVNLLVYIILLAIVVGLLPVMCAIEGNSVIPAVIGVALALLLFLTGMWLELYKMKTGMVTAFWILGITCLAVAGYIGLG